MTVLDRLFAQTEFDRRLDAKARGAWDATERTCGRVNARAYPMLPAVAVVVVLLAVVLADVYLFAAALIVGALAVAIAHTTPSEEP